jgi:tRNA (adenine22-N1)-methyltransferase
MDKMTYPEINIDARLKALAGYVRSGNITADIGSDHAYLPIWLVQQGITDKVIACDINAEPCRRAEENIKKYGCASNITVIRSDGLKDAVSYKPKDIIVAGMGGDVICDILRGGDYIKNAEIRLILQPMTRTRLVREFLLTGGFKIIGDNLTRDGRWLYNILAAEYDGVVKSFTPFAAAVGNIDMLRENEAFEFYINRLIKSVTARVTGKNDHGSEDTQLLEELRKLL